MILGQSHHIDKNQINAILCCDFIDKKKEFTINFKNVSWKIVRLLERDLNKIVKRSIRFIYEAFRHQNDPLGLLSKGRKNPAPIIVSSVEEAITQYCIEKNLSDLTSDEIVYLRNAVCGESLLYYFIHQSNFEHMMNDFEKAYQI